ncbi:MAG: DNA polymerase III subunit delta [Cytophagaceae bacterium]|nr:DNA polymerase III subunit delta [Cytophagaceae bacterium]
MASTPESILKDLKNNKYSPVYFLQGEESYYIDLIADYIEKNCLSDSEKSFNQTVLYGKDVNMNTILLNAKKFPMMAERQVVIVKEAQEVSDLGKESGDAQLNAYIQNPLPSTVLVFCYKYKSLHARKSLSKNLDKFSVVVSSKKIYDNQLPQWVGEYFGSKGFKINPKAALMLSEFVGNNLSRLSNESDKLLINIQKGQEVTEDHIEKYVGVSKEFNVFELQQALIRKDVYKANQIVNYFEANPKNNPVIPVLVVLFNFFTKLLLVHGTENRAEANLAKVLGVNPYFVKDYIYGVKSYSPAKVTHIIHYLRQADLHVKGVDNVSTSEGQVLKELVFKILH